MTTDHHPLGAGCERVPGRLECAADARVGLGEQFDRLLLAERRAEPGALSGSNMVRQANASSFVGQNGDVPAEMLVGGRLATVWF